MKTIVILCLFAALLFTIAALLMLLGLWKTAIIPGALLIYVVYLLIQKVK